MNSEFRHPTREEMEAYLRRGRQERSRVFAEMVGWLFAMLRGRRSSFVETLSTPTTGRGGTHGHRLAA